MRLSLFKALFNVNNAVFEGVEVKQSPDGVVSIFFDVRPYKRFSHICPHCGRVCPGYDRGAPRLWRSLDFAGALVYLRSAVPRVCCPEHGVVTAAVPWAFVDSGFTRDFDLQVAWTARYLPRSRIAELMRIDWDTVGRCVKRAQAHLDPNAEKRRLSGLVRIGVDETSYRKGHKYITVVVNHDTGEVVWVHDGHGKSVFELFFKQLTPEQRASILFVSGDGARWIDDCIAEYVPQAQRCVDPFHVVQWSMDSLDKVRLQIWRDIRKENQKISKEIKGEGKEHLKETLKEGESNARAIKASAYALGKAPEHLTDLQQSRLELIAATQPVLYRAYRLKEELRLILKMPLEPARDCLKKWYWRASHSRIEPMKELARKIKRHTGNILNTIEHGLSNARIEATNNTIKLCIRRAYGFRNVENLIPFVMLVCSKVQIPLPNRPLGAGSTHKCA